MFCIKCGSYLPDGSQFCGVCGAAQTVAQEPVAPPVAEAPVQYAPVQQPAWTDPYAQQAPVEPQPQVQTWADINAQTQPQPQAQTWADPYAQTYAQPQEQPQAQTWADPYAQPQAQPQAWADPFAYAQPQPEAPAPAPAKKKGSKRLIVTLVSLFAAVAVLACALVLPVMGVAFHNTKYGEWISHSEVGMSIAKVVAPSERYKELIYDTNVADTLASVVSKAYGSAITGYKDMLGGNKSAGITVSLEVGQTVQDMVAANIPAIEGVDVKQLVSLLNGASVSLSGGNSGDLYQMAVALGLGGKELVQATAILNFVQKQCFVGIPTISDTYLDVSAALENIDLDELNTEALDKVTSVIDALPSEETVNKLLSKYLRLTLDQFDNVEKSTEELNVGGARQKVTALSTKITQKDLVKVVPTLMKALQKDADVKNIIISVGNAIGALEGAENAGEELYDQFAEQEFDNEIDYDYEDDSYLLLTDYVSSNEVVGRKVTMRAGGEKQDILYYANIVKGGKFYFDMEMEMQGIAITGEGTDNKGVQTGTYTVKAADEDVLTIGVTDFDTNGIQNGYLKGTITLAPSAMIMENLIDSADLPSEITTAVSLLDCNLKVELDTSENAGHLKVSLCSKNEVLVGIALDSAVNNQPVSVPSADKTMEMKDIQEWLKTVDLSKVINTLKELGIPAELTDMLESAAEALKSGDLGGLGAVDPAPEVDFDDYYDDYYEDGFGTGIVVDDDYYGW